MFKVNNKDTRTTLPAEILNEYKELHNAIEKLLNKKVVSFKNF